LELRSLQEPAPEGGTILAFIQGVNEAAEKLGNWCGTGEKRPSAAKAGHFCCTYGTTEVVPFQRDEFFCSL
jgi:hypothetical protein